jgi:putative DNA primase/helicase
MTHATGSLLAPEPAGFPASLLPRRQFVAWAVRIRGGKPTKIPVNPRTGGNADATNPATWGTLAEALDCFRRRGLSGVGFVFTAGDPFLGIDLDKAADVATAALLPWAVPLVRLLPTYCERSPSGTGVHAIAAATKPGPRCRKSYGAGQVEMYDRERFFCLTGHRLPGSPAAAEACQDGVEAVYHEVFGAPRPQAPRHATVAASLPPLALTDLEIIERAKTAKNASKFLDLWGGGSGEHGSPSEGDLALAVMLAFWTRKDSERIATLFAQSARSQRAKWADRADYRERTIARAIELCGEVYDPEQLPLRLKQVRRKCGPRPLSFTVEV